MGSRQQRSAPHPTPDPACSPGPSRRHTVQSHDLDYPAGSAGTPEPQLPGRTPPRRRPGRIGPAPPMRGYRRSRMRWTRRRMRAGRPAIPVVPPRGRPATQTPASTQLRLRRRPLTTAQASAGRHFGRGCSRPGWQRCYAHRTRSRSQLHTAAAPGAGSSWDWCRTGHGWSSAVRLFGGVSSNAGLGEITVHAPTVVRGAYPLTAHHLPRWRAALVGGFVTRRGNGFAQGRLRPVPASWEY